MKNQIIKSSQYLYNPGPWEKEEETLTSHELWIRTGWMSLVAYGAEKDTISLKWFLPCCHKRMCYGNLAYAYPEYCGCPPKWRDAIHVQLIPSDFPHVSTYTVKSAMTRNQDFLNCNPVLLLSNPISITVYHLYSKIYHRELLSR